MQYLDQFQNNITFRKATLDDAFDISNILADAKKRLKASGSNQWNTSSYPDLSDVKADINNNAGYIIELKGQIIGYEALLIGEDENYTSIDGKWLYSGLNYLTIHRIAVSSSKIRMGYSDILIKGAFDLAKSLNLTSVRADTHAVNKSMSSALIRNGFTKCGIIKIQHEPYDNLRDAFEYIIKG